MRLRVLGARAEARLVAALARPQASSVGLGEGGRNPLNHLTCVLRCSHWLHTVEYEQKMSPQIVAQRDKFRDRGCGPARLCDTSCRVFVHKCVGQGLQLHSKAPWAPFM